MMRLGLGQLLVIFLYAMSLVVVLYISPKLGPPSLERKPFWRDVRFWASFVAIAQIVVYAIWG